jgi:ACS family glucarate transporter-like MFS transporter
METLGQPDSDARARPSRARLHVVALVCSLATILYLDRIVIGQAVGPIQEEFGLDNTAMSYVLNAFVLAYGIFEIPTGRWGDRYGSRRVLARIVLWWSGFTALTAACTGLWSLVVVRFLFGAGEAGAYPNVARIIGRWFPPGERGRVQGLLTASAGLGGALTPVIAGYLVSQFGWRSPFLVFGGIGVLWAVWFLAWFRDDPARHPAVNAAELAVIGHRPLESGCEPIPWRAALGNRTIWLLGMIACCGAFCSYLYFGWLPRYLQAGHGLSTVAAGWGSSVVFAGSTMGGLVGGLLADRMYREQAGLGRRRGRTFCATACTAAILLACGVTSGSTSGTVAAMAASCFCASLHIATWWNCVQEIAGRHHGSLFGLLNSAGIVGAMASQYVFGAAADWRGRLGYTGREQWEAAFGLYVVVLAMLGVAWLFVDTSRTVGGVDTPPAP